jgi:Tfp pilus assembly protein PilF
LDQAKALIEKALKLDPDNAAFLDSMGWVLYQSNQPEGALTYLLKAVQNSKEPDATVYEHLGDAYQKLKQMDKAREAWRKSNELEPKDSVRQKIEAK